VIEHHPLTGVGIGNLGYYAPVRRLDKSISMGFSMDPKNQWLLVTAELGLPGLVLLMALASAISGTLIKAISLESAGIAGAWIALAVISLFDSPVLASGRESGTVLLGFLLGLTLRIQTSVTNTRGHAP
jgi:O-antigen ligase